MASLNMSGTRRDFALLFLVMLTIAAGNTALQSVLPAIGRLLALPDAVIALTFSFSALVWALAAPGWARRSDRQGRKRMVLTGLIGFVISLLLCALALTAGISGWAAALPAFAGFIAARMIYGFLGAAAPPAAQALVASRTSRAERTNALTLLASAFGLGTILGPALAPFFMLPVVGLAGPAYIFALMGAVVLVATWRLLPDDGPDMRVHGAATAEPSIGGEPSGASVIAALNEQTSERLRWTDPRLLPWMISGLVAGHAQAMAGQAIGFLVMDRLELPPIAAQPVIGVVLMAGAAAALLAQWGIIPRLRLGPRAMVIWGALIAAAGCAMIASASDIHGLAVAFALASLGFGFLRPGFTAGASLAVGTREQGLVAGRVTSINGAVFVLGPSIGIGLYQIAPPIPYLLAAGALLLNAAYAARRLQR
ncbi:Major Facilitator Superfamily protein [Sphingomonas laterariae]|uniref:Major Facilitator Superfamily protein n=1 Tax=Edaphosphingomonas laterariae TaxID=861865 RepID=A0A239CW30_9SPHN|nr:MFS transporter [Sphingomonas laterariae]SNS23861.1 Major Facilitator Superfamily protein [Sphingomonas laterariae]